MIVTSPSRWLGSCIYLRCDSDYEERQKGSGIKYSWEYSGNNYGWWLYDDRANTLIEQHYQTFIESWRTLGLTPAQWKKARRAAAVAARSPRVPAVVHAPVPVPLVWGASPVVAPAAVDPAAAALASPAVDPSLVAAAAPPAVDPSVDPSAAASTPVAMSSSLAASIADGSAPLPINPHATFRLQIANSSYIIDFTRMLQESAHDASKYVHTVLASLFRSINIIMMCI